MRRRENVSLLNSAACAQTICICLHGHALSFSRVYMFSFMYLHLFVSIVATITKFLLDECVYISKVFSLFLLLIVNFKI